MYKFNPTAYNKYYKKCRLVEHPQLVISLGKLKYKCDDRRLIGWISQQYAIEGNLLTIWDKTYQVMKVFPTITTKKYIDKIQEPMLC